MADQTPQNPPGTVPIVDRRPPPRGVIPRRAQTWLMLGLAVVILGIIAITGSPDSGPRPGNAPLLPSAATPPNPSRLRDYQDRLRLLDERARMEALESSPLPSPTAQAQMAEAPEPDPLADERRRREYESRFARVAVLARHPEKQVPPLAAAGNRPSTAGGLDDIDPAPARATAAPSLDAVAEAVLRASHRQSTPSALGTQDAGRASAAAAEGADRRTSPVETSTRGARHRIPEGTLLETVLWNKLTLAGDAPVICRVTTPVFSRNLQQVVIPADALVLGQTKAVGGTDDPLLAVSFHQLRMPDETRYELKHASALNREGDAGLRDRIDRHYPTIFGAAGAIGLITGLAQAVGGRTAASAGGDRTVVIAGSAADASSQAAAQALGHFLNRRPTGTIRRGHRVLVYLTHDLELPAYTRFAPEPSSIH